MGWGSILSTIGTAISPTLGSVVKTGFGIYDAFKDEDNSNQANDSYYQALARQETLAQVTADTARQRAAFESAMRERLLTQTGDMGADMRQAQANMGAMPQFNEGTVKQDYQNTKATMMGDFNDMLRLVESQGRSNQIERLGGAGSMAADNSRMNALIKQYSPELQKIDDAAMDSAINRQTQTMNLYSTNRENTLNEIQNVYQPQINSETALMNNLDIGNLINASGGQFNQARTAAQDETRSSATSDALASDSLGTLLSQAINKYRTPGINPDEIRWN